jgi:low affinity Fe/Cu permease
VFTSSRRATLTQDEIKPMKTLERLSEQTTRWAGSSWALLAAFLATIGWAVSGPVFGFSDTWQLTFNTLSSVVTFLMVFVIQRDQNKQTLVLQTKLNELLASSHASNRLIDIEDLTEEEVSKFHQRFQELAKKAAAAGKPTKQTSVEKIRTEVERDEDKHVERVSAD